MRAQNEVNAELTCLCCPRTEMPHALQHCTRGTLAYGKRRNRTHMYVCGVISAWACWRTHASHRWLCGGLRMHLPPYSPRFRFSVGLRDYCVGVARRATSRCNMRLVHLPDGFWVGIFRLQFSLLDVAPGAQYAPARDSTMSAKRLAEVVCVCVCASKQLYRNRCRATRTR